MADREDFLRPGFTMYSTAGENRRRARCEFCGRTLTAHQAVSSGICDSPECHARKIEKVGTELLARRRHEQEARMRKTIADAGTHVDAALAELDAPRETVSIAIVPWQDRPVEPLPEARRAAFRAHLEEIAALAFAPGNAEGEPEKAESEPGDRQEGPEPPVVVAACSTCQGHCCARRGGDTALLLPADLARYRQRHPDRTTEGIIEAYLAHLPATSTRDGCVYQAATGCSLPREMRQGICNTYYCDALRWLNRDYLAKRSGKVVFVAADEDDRPRRVARFDLGQGWRPITELTPADDDDADAGAGTDAAQP